MPASVETLAFPSSGTSVTADPTKIFFRLCPCAEVVSQRMGDEIVLIHLGTNRIYQMNRTSARVWELLSAGHDLESIRAVMCEEFDVDEASLMREMEAFLQLLTEEKLATR